MEATRLRFGAVLEWACAAAFVAAVVAFGSLLVSEMRNVRAVMPVIAGPAPVHDTPIAVPPGAVSVPMLHLANGRQVRLGDRLSDVAARLDAASRAFVESLERTSAHEHITRFYEYAGTRFVLVFEALERNAEPQVAAIYLRAR
jgi:hypothetical protein